MALNEIRYKGAAYTVDGDIWMSSGSWYETKSLKCDSLEVNSFEVTVSDSDRAITSFRKNDKVEYFRDGRRMGIFYLQTVERVGPDSYHLSGISAVGLLMTRPHNGGIYTGQTAGDVIRDICGDIPVKVESVYENRKLYGWLPYVQPFQSSARDNLAEVLFAIGAWLGVDNDGVLRVEKLWDGTASAIGPGLIHAEGCSVQYTDAVSAVEITEHQWVPSSDAVTLFEGTTEQGALIVFDDPAHDLTADGFTILESGANYAVVSAGSGTLTGQGYTHITRIIRKTVAEDAEENVVAITDAHLVSLTNSVDVANRTADYYRHRETIQVDINPLSGPPGNVVQIYHPWDKVMVSACIAERETTISGLLKSGIQALVGFTPPQPDTAEYFDEQIFLTDRGSFTLPEGSEALRAVLIGAGSPGTAGSDGDGVFSASATVNSASASFSGVSAGAGGAGGIGGAGGKILIITPDLSTGRTFAYDATGSDVTFGGKSSADGTASEAGYFDTVTQQYFGRKGKDGYKGGNGGSVGSPGGAVNGYSGGDGTSQKSITYSWSASGTTYKDNASIAGFGGGGAANGSSGNSANGGISWQGVGFKPNVRVKSSAAGANGAVGKSGENYGDGGDGGNGGGGAGAVGTLRVSFSPSAPSGESYYCTWSGVWLNGGAGSAGGAGKQGCIILYYRRAKKIKSGPLVTSDGKWLLDKLGRRVIV